MVRVNIVHIGGVHYDIIKAMEHLRCWFARQCVKARTQFDDSFYRLFEEKVGIGLSLMEEFSIGSQLSLRFGVL